MAKTLTQSLKPFLAMKLQEKALEMEQSGQRVIKLSIGQPDFTTPDCIIDAAQKAMRDGKTGYTHSLGIWELREGLAEYYATEYGLSLAPERIVITSGSSFGLLMLFEAILDEGDEVIIGNPAYACYENFVRCAGGAARAVPAREEEGFQLDPEKVRAALTPGTRGVIVNSPSNPGGTVMPPENLRALAGLCAEGTADSGPLLISDEIYHGLSYEGQVSSALEFSDNCIVADGFSKRYAMTGWRLGWLVLPEALVPPLNLLLQNFSICAPSVSQWAGLAALKDAGPDTRRMAAEYGRRRLILMDALREAGFGVKSSPSGAFYILADARAFCDDSLLFSYELLEQAKVSVAPGIDFGSGAEGYLRFSYANSVENIQEGMQRIKKYLENR
ncbi:MAG: pyridoxal phosphate-dependent aminotransferase [Deltaproteobacteria bacterium]|jgi:aspartate/methionine/tyrosine aminotransferase|nr:pyridoxal phosphate-dependent aminotransferase [Deltaproteobacteria bacterium]